MSAVALAQIDTCMCVCERSTCALVCQAENKRGCVSNCDCGVTHSCTAGHAFSAASCCTVSRWHSWRKNLAPDNACSCCCCTLFLWLPSPSLSAALFLGSYPAEEQEMQAQREVFICKLVFSLMWYMAGYDIAKLCQRQDV